MSLLKLSQSGRHYSFFPELYVCLYNELQHRERNREMALCCESEPGKLFALPHPHGEPGNLNGILIMKQSPGLLIFFNNFLNLLRHVFGFQHKAEPNSKCFMPNNLKGWNEYRILVERNFICCSCKEVTI